MTFNKAVEETVEMTDVFWPLSYLDRQDQLQVFSLCLTLGNKRHKPVQNVSLPKS